MRLSLAPVSSPQWRKRAMIRGRGKRRRGWVAPEIPWEIEMEILIRLPAKSLTRFLCVSKLWLSLIRSRYFTNRYRLTVASTPRLYMSLVDQVDPPSSTVVTRESVLLSLSSSSSSSEYLSPDFFFPGMGGHNMVAIRGFIFYHVPGEAEAYIYNPTTGQFITLATIIPSISAEKGFLKHYLFGYDPVLDQYKVACTFLLASRKLKWITSLEHWVIVLEPGGSWKKIEFDGQPHRPTRLGLCINGVVYYLASTCMPRDIVVSFDVRSEEFNMTQAPVDVVSAHWKPVGFIEYGGKPAIFDHTNLVPMGLMDLWVLEDGGRWSRKSLALKPCQMHLVDNNTRLIAHGTTRDGEVILAPFPLLSPYYILYYDVQKNDLRKVGIGGIPDHWFSNPDLETFMYLTQLDTSESIIYLEI